MSDESPPMDKRLAHLPHTPGVYIMRDAAGRIVYIGKAIDLRKRVSSYFRPQLADPKLRALVEQIRHIDYIVAQSEREALVIEQKLINRHQPAYNAMWKDDKSYPYVKLTMNEDFPRLTMTRKRKKDGALYYGPFPNARGVSRLLRWLWKSHMFPLRPCRIDFGEGDLPPKRKVQSCLYLHTGACPAPCVASVSKAEYRKIAERAALFFEGRHDELRAQFDGRMRAAAARLDFEEAARLRDHVRALEHIEQRVTFRAIRPEDVESRITSTQAVRALQEALNLPKPPVRIEAFDISHHQGAETVASMVCFEGGRPKKDQYRTFTIKTVSKVDDFASMREVVGRRYKRLENEGADWPDLILIDGGAGQLSAAMEALKAVKGRLPPVISLAKRMEEIYRPGVESPLALPSDSPALHLLRHVRDESHRFAIGFHRRKRRAALRAEARAAFLEDTPA